MQTQNDVPDGNGSAALLGGTPRPSSLNNGNREYNVSSVVILFLVPALGSFLFGQDIGATSFAILQLTDPHLCCSSDGGVAILPKATSWAPLLTGLVVAAPSLGALLGSTIVFGIADVIGRRRELQLGSYLYIFGALLESIPTWISIPHTDHNNAVSMGLMISILLLGRLTYGIGIGFTMHGAPTYLGETMPSSIRGALVSLKEACIVLGMMFGYGLGFVWSDTRHGWAYTYLASLVPSTIMCVMALYVIPPSPRWLVLQERFQEAHAALAFVYTTPTVVEYHYRALVAAVSTSTATSATSGERRPNNDAQPSASQALLEPTGNNPPTLQQGTNSSSSPSSNSGSFSRFIALLYPPSPPSSGSTDDTIPNDTTAMTNDNVNQHQQRQIKARQYWATLRVGLGLVLLQQVTGQPSILSYATPLLQEAGLNTFSSVLVAAFKLVSTLTTVMTVEIFGRKNNLYFGCTLMLVALAGLATEYHFRQEKEDDGDANDDDSFVGAAHRSLVLIAMFVYIGGYQVGFGPITWLIMSEVFPLAIRGQAVALAVQMNFLLNALVQVAVPLMQSWWGLGNTFGLFGVLTAYSIYFTHAYVLETKGLTLEEIEAAFAERTATSNTTQGQPEENSEGENEMPA